MHRSRVRDYSVSARSVIAMTVPKQGFRDLKNDRSRRKIAAPASSAG